MALYETTYHSKIYRDFKAIDNSDYRTIVSYYEKHEGAICQIEFEEYFEMLYFYSRALFETGSYQKHLLMGEVVIQTSILHNFSHWQGIEIFQVTLFRMAAANFNLMHYDKAEHILRELVKINPKDAFNVRFLKKCIRRRYPNYVKTTRAIAIFIFIISAILVCTEVLFIRTFFKAYAQKVEYLRFATFGLGWLVLITGDVIHRWNVERKVKIFIEKIASKKQEKADMLT